MKKTLSTLLCLGAAATAVNAAESEKPNLILFMADDCSHTDIGCYGGVNVPTPNIDRFAEEGMLFEKGYQAAPMSSPTRHNLYTGIWPVKSGAYPNHTSCYDGVKSIVHHLHPQGYKVALIGKKHVGSNEVFPFDLYQNSAEGGDVNFEAIKKFIDECTAKGEPYCLFVTSNQPHTPWNKGDVSKINKEELQLPPIYVDTPETRNSYSRYLAEVNYMDAEFGQLLDILDEKKQRDNSVVVFLSEQGNSLPFAKYTCYEAGVRSAYVVQWRGKVKPGSRCSEIVEYLDITPTFVDIAGGEPVAPVDGVSIKGHLLGDKKAPKKKYTYSLQTTRGVNNGSLFYGIRSVADKRYRYIINLTPKASFKNGLVTSPMFNEWKGVAATGDKHAKRLVHDYQHRPAEELYDIQNDPYCTINLIDRPKLAEKQAELTAALKAWMTECGDKGQPTEMNAYNRVGKMTQKKIDAAEEAAKAAKADKAGKAGKATPKGKKGKGAKKGKAAKATK